jgi:hypothetical protein
MEITRVSENTILVNCDLDHMVKASVFGLARFRCSHGSLEGERAPLNALIEQAAHPSPNAKIIQSPSIRSAPKTLTPSPGAHLISFPYSEVKVR